MPSLVLRGVGRAIAHPAVRRRVLILNSRSDRETGPRSDPMTARDFVLAIAKAAAGVAESREESRLAPGPSRPGLDPRRYVTHLIYLGGRGTPAVDEQEIRSMGIECVKMGGKRVESTLRYDEVELMRALDTIIDS